MTIEIKRLAATIASSNEYSYHGKHMGEKTLSVSVESLTPIAFNEGDSILFRGNSFYLLNAPTENEVYSKEIITYNLTFVHEQYQMDRVLFKDVVPNNPDNEYYNNQTHDVIFMGTVDNLMGRFIENMDNLHTGWSYVIDPSVTLDVKEVILTNQYCSDALSLVNSLFGLQYWISNKTIYIGGLGTQVGGVFEYGKGKGICELTRTSQGAKPITRLYIDSSSRNIPSDYNTSEKFKYNPQLMLPDFLVTEKNYIDSPDIDLNNVKEGILSNDDIFPSIEGSGLNDMIQVDSIADTDAGFTVYIKDIGFNISDQIIAGTTPLIEMTSGLLTGYQFEIHSVVADTSVVGAGYKLVLIRNTDIENQPLPNDSTAIKTGDKFVVLNVNMDQSYIDNAEARLLAWGQDQFTNGNIDKESITYNAKFSEEEIFDSVNESDVIEGNLVHIIDAKNSVDKTIIIQELTISYSEDKILPTYDLSIADTVVASKFNQIIENQDAIKKSTSVSIKTNATLARRMNKALNAIDDLVVGDDGKIRGENISAGTVDALKLSTGTKAGNFILNSKIIPNYSGDETKVFCSLGVLIHLESDINFTDGNNTWNIAQNETFTINTVDPYWIYIKANKDTGSATWEIFTVPQAVDQSGYYFLPWGVLLVDSDGNRLAQATKGRIYAIGDQLYGGRVQDLSGINYFDLTSGKFTMGTANAGIDWGITTENVLTIRGALVQSPSGVESPISVWRGEWVTATQYYKGDEVSYEGSSYISNADNISQAPNVSASWDLKVQSGADGVAGDAGADGNDGADGVDGQSIQVQYSNDALNWHADFVVGDIYMRQQVLGVWSPAVLFVGVDGVDGSNGVDGVDGYSIVWQGSFASHPVNPENGWAYKNTSDGKSYTYRGGTWFQMNIDGVDGIDGNDGLDIVWKGVLATSPPNAEKNWVYKDSDNGITYIYTGTAWEVMVNDGSDGSDGSDGTSIDVQYSVDGSSWHASYVIGDKFLRQEVLGVWSDPIKFVGDDGQDGIDGSNGVDGADGVSLSWIGSFVSHPVNPENGWAYKNTVDGKSYTYRSGTWYQMTIDGTDGIDGNDGVSFIWKGSSASAPVNPELNWVYKDTDNGITYIYNGSSWEIMVSDGVNGANGQDIDIEYSVDGSSWHASYAVGDKYLRQNVLGVWSNAIKFVGDKGTTGFFTDFNLVGDCVVNDYGEVSKPTGSNTFDSKAYSKIAFQSGASVSFKTSSNNLYRAVSLNTDPTSGNSITDLGYTLYLRGDGTIYIYEDGVNKGSFGTYSAEDMFSIVYDNDYVRYYHNGSVLRVVSAVSDLNLFFDVIFSEVSTTSYISNFTFSAVGSNGATGYFKDFNVAGNCVVSNQGGVSKPNGANGQWDSQVSSKTAFKGGAMATAKFTDKTIAAGLGLSQDPTVSNSYSTVDYIMMSGGGASPKLNIFESGSFVDIGSVDVNDDDIFTVVYNNTSVQYYLNDVLIHQSVASPDKLLYLDSSFATVSPVISMYNFGFYPVGSNGIDGADGAAFSIDEQGLFANRPSASGLAIGYTYFATDTSMLYFVEAGATWSVGTEFGKGEAGADGVDGINGTNGVDGYSIVWKGSFASHPSSPEDGWAYKNTVDGKSYTYRDGTWYQMTVDGVDGVDGNDGVDIVWKGESSSAPSNPERNWVYKDTDNGVTYIYTGTAWEVMISDGSDGSDGTSIDVQYSVDGSSWHASYVIGDKFLRQNVLGIWSDAIKFVGEDGKSFTIDEQGLFADRPNASTKPTGYSYFATDNSLIYFVQDNGTWSVGTEFGKGDKGDAGADGVDGQDGTSIVWKGSFSSHPSSPQNGWAYKNTVDGKSYIYQGAWYQMTIDGQDGSDGVDGSDGSDGLDIVWKGVSSSPPASPVKNWVYKDSDNGITYIYTGTAWEVMVNDGSDGANGTNGTDIEVEYSTDGINWHDDFVTGDKYLRQNVLGVWSPAIKFVGEDGAKGDKGDAGAGLLFRGDYDAGTTYVGQGNRRDIVKYNSTYYLANVDAGSFSGTLPTNTSKWESFGASFSSVATGLLFASLAYIENLGVRNLKTNDSGRRVEIDEDKNRITLYDSNGYSKIFIDTNAEESADNRPVIMLDGGVIRFNWSTDDTMIDEDKVKTSEVECTTLITNGAQYVAVKKITANYSIGSNDYLIVCTFGNTSSRTVYLPSNPTIGRKIEIKRRGGVEPIINGNGKTIHFRDNSPESTITLSWEYGAAMSLIYDGTYWCAMGEID